MVNGEPVSAFAPGLDDPREELEWIVINHRPYELVTHIYAVRANRARALGQEWQEENNDGPERDDEHQEWRPAAARRRGRVGFGDSGKRCEIAKQ